jgi:GT2 family glycosyltransferase
MKIGVVIPHYRNESGLKRCLDSLKRQTAKDIEVFVRDNSQDNILYTLAVNEGLRKFAFDDAYAYTLVLNHDVVLTENAIEKLVLCAGADSRIGLCCPIQVKPNTRDVYWGGSLQAVPWGRHDCKPLDDYKSNFETYWANGAAMLLRNRMVQDIGLLDSNMKFICSDSDYSFTARSRGWQVTVAHESIVYHSAGASGGSDDPMIKKIKLQDNLYFIKKWLSGDLYKSMSYEGEQLTRLSIKGYKEELIKKLGSLNLND